MGLTITIEGNIPEDCPAGIPVDKLKAVVRERLGLKTQDEVIIKFRETDRGGKGKYNKLHKKQTCKYKEYCSGDCAECQGDELKASLNILKSRKGR